MVRHLVADTTASGLLGGDNGSSSSTDWWTCKKKRLNNPARIKAHLIRSLGSELIPMISMILSTAEMYKMKHCVQTSGVSRTCPPLIIFSTKDIVVKFWGQLWASGPFLSGAIGSGWPGIPGRDV